MSMIWSPAGPAVPATISPAQAAQFAPTGNAGGVARIVNIDDVAAASFTLGGASVDNTTPQVHIPARSWMDVAYGIGVTHISASAAEVIITPGTARP